MRYRGYVYDNETGLYYLQSRYYNPELGRFINADDIAYLGADGTLLSYNLFAYCGNNPVIREDSDGNFWLVSVGAANAWNPVGWVVLGTVAVVAVGITVYQYSEHKTTKNGKKLNKHQKGNARRKRDQGGEKKKLKPIWKRRR